jgi:peptide/nickel transport system permease protein
MLRQRDFLLAAQVSGEGHLRIMVSELLPNMTSLLVAQVIGSTVYAIGAQVGLEFLGLGDVSRVTWGTNLYWATNDSALLTGAWWTFVPTGLCVALVGFGLVMLNSGFDELGNPRLQQERRWREHLASRGVEPTRSTPVVVDRG